MKRFLTEYRKPDGPYCGHVDALDFEHAQAICDERGLGEEVKGVLYAVIQASEHFGDAQANEILKAYAESDYDEPPDADEFK